MHSLASQQAEQQHAENAHGQTVGTAYELQLAQLHQHRLRLKDMHSVEKKIEAKGTMPNIPPKANRIWKNCFSPYLYRDRNAIERMFCRLKDFRRVATRYDRLAVNYLAAVFIAATVAYWL